MQAYQTWWSKIRFSAYFQLFSYLQHAASILSTIYIRIDDDNNNNNNNNSNAICLANTFVSLINSRWPKKSNAGIKVVYARKQLAPKKNYVFERAGRTLRITIIYCYFRRNLTFQRGVFGKNIKIIMIIKTLQWSNIINGMISRYMILRDP
jgi:DNA polymerase elongation subunit (family B)